MFLAKHLDLPLDQRNSRATPHVRKPQAREHRMVPLEEVRVVLEIRCDGSLFGFRGG